MSSMTPMLLTLVGYLYGRMAIKATISRRISQFRNMDLREARSKGLA